jgi:hypothetical protein
LFESLSKNGDQIRSGFAPRDVSKNPTGESPSDLEKAGDSAFNPEAGHPA